MGLNFEVQICKLAGDCSGVHACLNFHELAFCIGSGMYLSGACSTSFRRNHRR